MGTEHLGYPFKPLRVPPYLLPSNAHLPHCPLAKIWGKWAQGTCGTPLEHLRCSFPPNVQVPICHGGHMQTFGEMDTRHLGYPFRELGVAYPFPPHVHFPQVPICPGAHFSRCPFAPNINFFQQPICPKSPFISMPICPECFFCHLPGAHMPRCPFASSAHLPQVSVYSKFSVFPNAHLP